MAHNRISVYVFDCDQPGCGQQSGEYRAEGQDAFKGHLVERARDAARVDGWLHDRYSGKDYCPHHAALVTG